MNCAGKFAANFIARILFVSCVFLGGLGAVEVPPYIVLIENTFKTIRTDENGRVEGTRTELCPGVLLENDLVAGSCKEGTVGTRILLLDANGNRYETLDSYISQTSVVFYRYEPYSYSINGTIRLFKLKEGVPDEVEGYAEALSIEDTVSLDNDYELRFLALDEDGEFYDFSLERDLFYACRIDEVKSEFCLGATTSEEFDPPDGTIALLSDPEGEERFFGIKAVQYSAIGRPRVSFERFVSLRFPQIRRWLSPYLNTLFTVYENSNGSFISNTVDSTLPVPAASSIATIWGSSLIEGVFSASTLPLPTELDGLKIEIQKRNTWIPVSMFYASPVQINVLIPPELSSGDYYMRLSREEAESVLPISIGSVSPGVFTSGGVGILQSLYVHSDGSRTQEDLFGVNASGELETLPLRLQNGSQAYLIVWGTGFRNATSVKSIFKASWDIDVPVLAYSADPNFIGLDQVVIGPVPSILSREGQVDLKIEVTGREDEIAEANLVPLLIE